MDSMVMIEISSRRASKTRPVDAPSWYESSPHYLWDHILPSNRIILGWLTSFKTAISVRNNCFSSGSIDALSMIFTAHRLPAGQQYHEKIWMIASYSYHVDRCADYLDIDGEGGISINTRPVVRTATSSPGLKWNSQLRLPLSFYSNSILDG